MWTAKEAYRRTIENLKELEETEFDVLEERIVEEVDFGNCFLNRVRINYEENIEKLKALGYEVTSCEDPKEKNLHDVSWLFFNLE
jgi:hypothetical protein